jgi:hypothetical protein
MAYEKSHSNDYLLIEIYEIEYINKQFIRRSIFNKQSNYCHCRLAERGYCLLRQTSLLYLFFSFKYSDRGDQPTISSPFPRLPNPNWFVSRCRVSYIYIYLWNIFEILIQAMYKKFPNVDRHGLGLCSFAIYNNSNGVYEITQLRGKISKSWLNPTTTIWLNRISMNWIHLTNDFIDINVLFGSGTTDNSHLSTPNDCAKIGTGTW